MTIAVSMPADFPPIRLICIGGRRAGTDAGRPGLPHAQEVL
jgi:hypothetical protein